MTKKEKKQMSATREKLQKAQALINEALAGLPSETPEKPSPAPDTGGSLTKPPVAKPTNGSAIPANILALAATALEEATKLERDGHDVAEIIQHIISIPSAKSLPLAHEQATIAFGGLEILQDRNVDVSALRSVLNKLTFGTSDGFGGNIPEGDTDVTGDMTGVLG